MNPLEAQHLAIELIDEHVTTDRPKWSFSWLTGVSQLGRCNYVHGYIVIQLNHRYTMLAEEKEVRDTIIHEIAHGLVGSGHGHDYVWKMKCRQLGIRPMRCASHEDKAAVELRAESANYVAECATCHKKHYAMKYTKNMRFGRVHCSPCARRYGFNDNNKLTYNRA